MSNMENLHVWDVEARKAGLLDVKLVRGSDRYATPEQVAGELLKVLTGFCECVPVENIDLLNCPPELQHFFLDQ